MYIEWTKHLNDPENKSKFQKSILASKDVLDRLKQILEEKEQALDRSETDIATYNTPNWAERQAHKNGNRESIHFLKKLIDLDQQKIT